MDNIEIVENLTMLVKLYSDSAWNYERALDQIQDEDMRQQLLELHDQHLESMENLGNYIKQLGGKSPHYEYSGEMDPDLKIINNEMSDDLIIRALRQNERVLSKKLEAAIEGIQIPEIAHDLEDDLEDEKVFIDTLQDYML